MQLHRFEFAPGTTARMLSEGAAVRKELASEVEALMHAIGPDTSSLQLPEPPQSTPSGFRMQLPAPEDPCGQIRYAVALERTGKHRRALDRLYQVLGDLLEDEKFAACDELLKKLDIREMDTHLLVGLLTITLSFREHLPTRAALVERVSARLSELAPERLERLLAGLR